jgi:hypothetical protein
MLFAFSIRPPLPRVGVLAQDAAMHARSADAARPQPTPIISNEVSNELTRERKPRLLHFVPVAEWPTGLRELQVTHHHFVLSNSLPEPDISSHNCSDMAKKRGAIRGAGKSGKAIELNRPSSRTATTRVRYMVPSLFASPRFTF